MVPEEVYLGGRYLPFRAKITAVANSSGTYLYSWNEVGFEANGTTLADADPGRSGTSAASPAYELNNKQVVVNTIVWMRQRWAVAGEPTYEFMAPDDTVSGGGASASTDKYEAYYRETTGSGRTRYYPVANADLDFVVANNLQSGVLYTVPFLSTRGGTIDVALYVSLANAGAKVRLGIYSNTSDTNLYPVSLVASSGELDCSTTGIKSWAAGYVLTANKLYWMALVTNDTVFEMHTCEFASVWAIHGVGDIAAFSDISYGWAPTHAYGALPGTFSGNTMLTSGNFPTNQYIPVTFIQFTA